ncbi:MAG: type II toxin-antitoxin system PemK/MazF family toxin [Parachlamydiaceae bacterium]|nr:type II toxin-antitoxin system PemK/MazF family toxin [Parachlamydiaceae bacterium]
MIISGNIGNQYSPLVMVAPITSNTQKIYPFEVQFNLADRKCKVMLNQARALDKSRLGKKKFSKSRSSRRS